METVIIKYTPLKWCLAISAAAMENCSSSVSSYVNITGLAGSGWIDDHILEEQYWRIGPYLPEDVAMEEVAPGVRLPFMHRPLSRYIHVMGEVGLLIEDMDEPAPPPGFLAAASEYGDASSIAAQGTVTHDLSQFVNPAYALPKGCNIRILGMAPGASIVAS